MLLRKLLVSTAALLMITSASWAQLSSYSEDFEGLIQSNPYALGDVGWLVYGNVYDSGGCLYPYGPFGAPNDFASAAFSLIASGQGGAAQGAQQLVVFSDYNNGDHGDPARTIESNVFREQVIGATDVGKTYEFRFDAKLGDIQPPSTALAFIKTVDLSSPGDCPAPGLSNFITLDMTSIPTTWGTYSISILIDASLVGQPLQFGFLNMAANYTSSGVFYDNVNFGIGTAVPVEETTWGGIKALFE